MLKNPIRRLPMAKEDGSPGSVEVAVHAMSDDLMAQWMYRIQPLINSHYERHEGGTSASLVDQDSIRADVGWNWSEIRTLARLHNALQKIPGNPSGPAAAMCLVIFLEDEPFPVGMLTCVPKFHCNVHGRARQRGFTWYLADAPSEGYEQVLHIPPLRGVARALLDCAIQATLDAHPIDAAQLLHADSAGGDKLLNFYTNRGMTRLPAGEPAITPFWRRRFTDQYFAFDDAGARAYSKQYDGRRQGPLTGQISSTVLHSAHGNALSDPASTRAL